MVRLLRIDSSPRAARSHTRRLTAAFVDMWRHHHPDDVVSSREVGLRPPPPVDENWIAAAFCAPSERTAAMRAALALSEELVDELLSTDLLVIGVPMYNFGIPAALKAYIDQIVRIGRTFAFEPHDTAQPYKPLVRGKQAIVIVSSGDAGYGQGEPLARLNQVEPYLRTVLGYIGILQIDFVYAGNDEFGGDRLDQSLTAALARVDELAASNIQFLCRRPDDRNVASPMPESQRACGGTRGGI
jgi:FMN-dependent NADH-azoreductase